MRVFLTGGSGFLGRHCLDYLLKRGHTVVTTVRSHEKGKQILQDYQESSGKLDYCVIKDISQPGAFDTAIQHDPPFEAVLHTASPFHYHAKDLKKDMIEPAVNGTTSILKAIATFAPSVKRVVITSSFAAVVQMTEAPPLYTESAWNPITMEQALSSSQLAYVGSKKFAEKAAWDFVEEERPGFSLSTINPVMIFGPVSNNLKSLDAVNTSNQRFRDIIQGKMKSGIVDDAFSWVDVRDVALAHVRAIEVPEAAGRRFIAAEGPYNNQQIAKIIKEKFPGLAEKLPEKFEIPPVQRLNIDTNPMTDVLGISFRSLEQCVVDTIDSLVAVD
ncbi:dihydroflavonol-4-reductase [Bisporella sp. PMI_857]|nr:dihydroflavonol-4-reductase [Bisporella sp. PMI_857]